MHTCPLVDPGPKPHVGGPVSAGSPDVQVGFMAAARVGDVCQCASAPDAIAQGSATVMINSRPAARVGDLTAHGGVIVAGEPTVIIGDA
jgi:uncharacterized Zn-binding protein involved in type VI secretion